MPAEHRILTLRFAGRPPEWEPNRPSAAQMRQ